MLLRKKKHRSVFDVNNFDNTLHKNLSFTAREQYKMLRTNIFFTLPDEVKCPVIGITSSTRGEGKSTTSINLSYVMAESGKKVLLIDADLRLPSIAKKMKVSGSYGLSDILLSGEVDNIEAFKSPVLQNWYILPSGSIPPNPSELLGSAKMRRALKAFSEMFDFIIIDLPPVNIVTDALVASELITGMVLVVREDYSDKRELDDCVKRFKLSDVNVLGFVMNMDRDGSSSYGRYNKKKYSSYKYYKKQN